MQNDLEHNRHGKSVDGAETRKQTARPESRQPVSSQIGEYTPGTEPEQRDRNREEPSWAAALQATPRQRCCGATGIPAASLMISADDATPRDRPNLSKDFRAGTASEEWIPLRSMDFYREHQIELLLNTRVAAIDPLQEERPARRWQRSQIWCVAASDGRGAGEAQDSRHGLAAGLLLALAQ